MAKRQSHFLLTQVLILGTSDDVLEILHHAGAEGKGGQIDASMG
jgi:hypothetical protein